VRGAVAGKTLCATLSGRSDTSTVTFLKTYDVQVAGYDAVIYEGVIADDGREIVGTWSIPGNWSGAFIMIRSRGASAARVARTTAKA
jgi:hypothetical protein